MTTQTPRPGMTVLVVVIAMSCLVHVTQARPYRSFIDKYSSHKKYIPRSNGYRFSDVPYSLGGGSSLSNKIMRGSNGNYLIPLEDLLLDLAGYTGHTMGKVPGIMRGIKHEMYIAKHGQDPLLHEILKRYGFTFTGTPMGGLGGIGGIGGIGGTQDIFNSLGVGGVAGVGPGVTSVQTPLPGMTNSVNDDLFDDFDNGLLGLASETKVARDHEQPDQVKDAPNQVRDAPDQVKDAPGAGDNN